MRSKVVNLSKKIFKKKKKMALLTSLYTYLDNDDKSIHQSIKSNQSHGIPFSPPKAKKSKKEKKKRKI